MIKTLSDALAERGYETLTAVQEAVNAPELQDADLLVSAQTGSGKTVGFGLAIAHTLLGDNERMEPASAPLALVVAPTRELAFQVMRELEWLYAKAGARLASCVGGMDMRDERRKLERGAHIVVGTPGRLRDHIQRGSLDMTGLRAIVLDEADEMLDLGFREDLEFMLGEAPEDRRTLLFSATVPPMIAKLAKQFQRDAVRVSTQSNTSQHADISYQALRVAQTDSENAIFNLLRYHDAQNAIVFANTRVAVNHLTARLANRGFSVVTLSGELSQNERTHALQAMRDGRAKVCVATDVAARGIDLPGLDLVIHADLPTNAEGLLHRSGRTGRAGRKGISALIIPPRSIRKAEQLLKFAKIQAEWTTPPSADDINRRDEERLLADPVWAEDMTEEQGIFAAKLLELHTPEQIAAAYLRLFRARQSAPEDLTPPDARPDPRERKPFGPSVWFSVSVGRDDRAEPRWLLPLLCRSGNLTKEAIGAIRIQQSESFVEITEASLAGFLSALGASGELEEGVIARQLSGPPTFAASPRSTSPREFSKPARPKSDRPRGDDMSDGSSKPRDFASKPRQKDGAYKAAPVPKTRRELDEAHQAAKPRSERATKPAGAGKSGAAPKRHKGAAGDASGKPFGGKPGAGKPFGGKAAAKYASTTTAKPGEKPKSGAAKPGKGKPGQGGGLSTPKRQKH